MQWFRKLRKRFGKKKGYRFPNGIPVVPTGGTFTYGGVEFPFGVSVDEFHRRLEAETGLSNTRSWIQFVPASVAPTQTILDILESNEDQ